MYSVYMLPSARRDMLDISRYIASDLKNPDAADKLVEAFIQEVDMIAEFPYARSGFSPIRPLSHEYRWSPAKNHLIFYWVEESKKSVTIARVIYAKRNVYAALRQIRP